MDPDSDWEEQKTPKQLTDARHEFSAYLEDIAVPNHYLSVSSRGAPLRRVDGDKVTALDRLTFIRDRFTWNDVQCQWTRNDGGLLVTEDQIYDIILSFQREYQGTRGDLLNAICAKVDGVHSRDVRKAIGLWGDLLNAICAKVDGVHSRDVRKAIGLWKEHELGSLDVLDDTLWGGPAAVYDPTSIFTSANSDHSEDPLYSTPGTDLPSRTRTRTHVTHALPRPKDATSWAFHPDHSDWLHIGTCKEDETDIWLSLVLRSGSQEGQLHPVFHDNSAKTIYESAVNIIWHEEFKYSNFPGTESEKKRAQRSYLWGIIQDHIGDLVPPPRSTGRMSISGKRQSDPTSRVRIPATQYLLERAPLTGQSSAPQTSDKTELEHARRSTTAALTPTSPPTAVNNKRRRNTIAIESGPSGEDERQHSPRPTKRTTVGGTSSLNSRSLISIPSKTGVSNLPKMEDRFGHDPRSNPFEGFSSKAIAGTSLLVSAEHQPGRAPANVPLDDCETQEKLFETLVIECNLRGKAATEMSAVSATYTWNQKQHLIRRGRPRDWSVFCEDIRKAWDRDASRFSEDGCDIKIMVHVDA